jgi:hypothetical protein
MKTMRFLTCLPAFLGAALWLATAGGAAAQSTDQTKKDEAAKKRTFNDADLQKYKGKGNISQSTLGPAKEKKASSGAAARSDGEDWFRPGLDASGEHLKAETLAAYRESEKRQAAAGPYMKRWADLHQQLAKARNEADRKRFQDQLRALEKEMTPALDAAREAEQRFDDCMARAYKAGILSAQTAEEQRKLSEARQAAKDSGR